MKFENTEVYNIKGALRGMRNPLQSHHKSDSFDVDNHIYLVGANDVELGQRLIRAGNEHRKFLRQIFVCVDITAPTYFMSELDTYKVGMTRNSSSFMHKGVSKPFEIEDFEIDDNRIIDILSIKKIVKIVKSNIHMKQTNIKYIPPLMVENMRYTKMAKYLLCHSHIRIQ